MAVVFISPKKNQKVFFTWIGIGAVLLVVIIYFWAVLAAGPSESALMGTYNRTKVVVNFTTFNSQQFKDLEYFDAIPLQFNYVATSAAGKIVKGVVTDDTQQDAQQKLEDSGLTVTQITPVPIGRDNPFVPYSSSGTTTTTTK